MLDKEHIEKYLCSSWAGSEVVYKAVTDSTNNDARELAREGAGHGTLVVADRQEKGRGSRGRSWETPAGENIAMSLILRPTAPAERISQLTLVMGLSVAEGIDLALRETAAANDSKEAAGDALVSTGIKWPNDVVIKGRKICGILTELHMNPDNSIRDVVIGVGINVNMTDFPEEIREIAGSLLSTAGMRVDRSLVVARCMERFEVNYESFQKKYDLSGLRQQYETKLINKGEQVRVLDSKEGYEGTALGITDMGELVIDAGKARDGEGRDIRIVRAGEVSVRGLYSYA
jgi:BirA family biotin operon repressor/biotin-[acetyl-CoA-carboxylase] ligase